MARLQVKTRTNEAMTLEPDTIRKFRESLRRDLMLSDDNEGILACLHLSLTMARKEREKFQ